MSHAAKCCNLQHDRPIRVAYADPPYPGLARKHYRSAEVDHRALIGHLVEQYPDGWALSTSSPALRELLPLCPPRTRVGAWVKPYSIFHVNVNPQYCWEPVVYFGGRRGDRRRPSVRDFVSCPITLRKGLVGAKPEPFCRWLFELLGLRAGDSFVDLFPGTGAVTRAWRAFVANPEGLPA